MQEPNLPVAEVQVVAQNQYLEVAQMVEVCKYDAGGKLVRTRREK